MIIMTRTEDRPRRFGCHHRKFGLQMEMLDSIAAHVTCRHGGCEIRLLCVFWHGQKFDEYHDRIRRRCGAQVKNKEKSWE